MLKKLRKIFIVIVLVLVALMIFVKLTIESSIFKNFLISQIETTDNKIKLKYDYLIINLDNIFISGIEFSNPQISSQIKYIKVNFDYFNFISNDYNPVALLEELNLKATKIELNLTGEKTETEKSNSDSTEFGDKELYNLLGQISEYAYVEKVNIDINKFTLNNGNKISVLDGFKFRLNNEYQKLCDIEIDTKLLTEDTKKSYLSDKLNINWQKRSIINKLDFNTEFNDSLIRKFGVNIRKVKFGDGVVSLSGETTWDIENSLKYNGNFSVSLDDAFYDNGLVDSFKLTTDFSEKKADYELNSSLLGASLNSNGSVKNYADPLVDVTFNFYSLKFKNIENILYSNVDSSLIKGKFENINIRKIKFNGSVKNPLSKDNSGEIYFDISKPEYTDYKVDKVKLYAKLSSGNVYVDTLNIKRNKTYLSVKAKSNLLEKNVDAEISGNGRIFEIIPQLKSTKLPEYKSTIKSKISFISEENHKANIFIKNISDNNSFDITISEKNGIGELTIQDEKSKLLSSNFNVNEKAFEMFIKDIKSLSDKIIDIPAIKDNDDLYADIKILGDNLNASFGSKSKKSRFGGDISISAFGNIDDGFDVSLGVQPIESDSTLLFPFETEIVYIDSSVILKDIVINGAYSDGYINYNLNNSSIDTDLNIEGLNLNGIVKNDISTDTDIYLGLNGEVLSPSGNVKIIENGLFYKLDNFIFSPYLANIDITLDNKIAYINKFLIRNTVGTEFDLAGEMGFDGDGKFNLNSSIDIQEYTPLIGKDIYGDLYLYSQGEIDDFNIKGITSTIKGDSVSYEDFTADVFDISLNITDKFVNVKKVEIKSDKLNLSMSSTIPYKNNSGNLYLDMLLDTEAVGLLKETGVIKLDGELPLSANLALSGTIKKPVINKLNFFIEGGRFNKIPYLKPIKNISGMIYLDGRKFVVNDLLIETLDKGRLIIRTIDNEEYENIEMSGYEIPPFGLSIAEGFEFNVKDYMKEHEYAELEIKGKDKNKFMIAGLKNGDLTIQGEVILKNMRFTAPLFSDESKKDEKKESKRKKKKKGIADMLYLDVDIIPYYGNAFYFDYYNKDATFWEKLKGSLSLSGNLKPEDVYIPLTPYENKISIKGPLSDPEKLEINGKISASNGRLKYAQMPFNIEEMNVVFDNYHAENGMIDPYVSLKAKTTMKTRSNTQGNVSNYEDIYLKVVTRDERGHVINSEGARVSEFALDIQGEDGNSWFSDQFSRASEIDYVQTAEEMVYGSVDSRFVSPVFKPLEAFIGRTFGVYLNVKPNITSNIARRSSHEIDSGDGVDNYFEGSEVSLSRFITDNTSISYNMRFVGDDDFTAYDKREFGYLNAFVVDHRYNKYIMTGGGVEYNTLTEEAGFNLSVGLKYRFRDFTYPYNFKRLFRKISEEF